MGLRFALIMEAMPETCPKCGKKSPPEGTACPRCGLIFALWKEDSVLPTARLDATGEALWQHAQQDWGDAARHEEFVKHCLQTDNLAPAGRLYRDRLDENPKDAIAAQMQSQILAKASLGLSIHKSQPRQPMTRSRWFWFVVLAAMALGIAGGLFWRRIQ
jgi:hypothetical protein